MEEIVLVTGGELNAATSRNVLKALLNGENQDHVLLLVDQVNRLEVAHAQILTGMVVKVQLLCLKIATEDRVQ